MKYLSFHLNQKGFTLIEMLVAVLIFSGSLITLIAVSSSTLSSITDTRQKMTAQYLAEEGIEYVRYIRDSFLIENKNDPERAYEVFKTLSEDCGAGCDFNVLENSGSLLSNPQSNMSYNADSGYTGRNPSAVNESKYNRIITVTSEAAGQIASFNVTSTTSWLDAGQNTQSVSFSTLLFFYRPK